MLDIPQKCCSKCGKSFPATLEYFHFHKSTRDKLRKECKECRSEQRRVYHAENRARDNALAQVWDETHKEQRQVYRDSRKPIRHEYDRRYTQEKGEQKQVYRDSHKDETRAQHEVYYQTHKEYYQEQGKMYRQTEVGQVVARTKEHNRRARKLAAPGRHTHQEILELYKKQGGKCFYCKAELNGTYHRDHVVPLSRGGTNDISNIVLACPHCNLTKHTKLLHEWPQGGRLM